MGTSYKYLGRVISAEEDDWPAVSKNQAKVQAVWRRLTCILSKEGATPPVSGFFKSCGAVGADFLCRNLGGLPSHGSGPREVPGSGVTTVDMEAPADTVGRKMGVHLGGGDNGGGRSQGNGGVH